MIQTIATASINGTRLILFSLIPIMKEGVSGVASNRASTASSPCNVGCRTCRWPLRKGYISKTKSTYHNTVKSTGPSSTLCMPKRRYPGIKTQTICQHFFYILSADRLKGSIMSSLGHDYDGLALSHFAMLFRLIDKNRITSKYEWEVVVVTRCIASHISSSHGLPCGGRSGTKMKSAPALSRLCEEQI